MPGQSSTTRSPEDKQQRPPAMRAMSLVKGLGIKTGIVEVDVPSNRWLGV